eukprot:gene11085-3151_t
MVWCRRRLAWRARGTGPCVLKECGVCCLFLLPCAHGKSSCATAAPATAAAAACASSLLLNHQQQ